MLGPACKNIKVQTPLCLDTCFSLISFWSLTFLDPLEFIDWFWSSMFLFCTNFSLHCQVALLRYDGFRRLENDIYGFWLNSFHTTLLIKLFRHSFKLLSFPCHIPFPSHPVCIHNPFDFSPYFLLSWNQLRFNFNFSLFITTFRFSFFFFNRKLKQIEEEAQNRNLQAPLLVSCEWKRFWWGQQTRQITHNSRIVFVEFVVLVRVALVGFSCALLPQFALVFCRA